MEGEHKELVQTLRDKAMIIADANELPDEDMIEWRAATVITEQTATIRRLTADRDDYRRRLAECQAIQSAYAGEK